MVDSIRAGRYTIPVIYLDNHLLVVVKPANLPVQRDASGDDDLLNILKGYIGEKFQKPGAVYLGLVHRLDRPVGGVMVFARTSKAAARLSAAFSTHEVDKRYLAVICGRMETAADLEDYLLKEDNGMVRKARKEEPGAKLARLHSEPRAWREGTTLTEVRLYTGRPHQIRVQHMLAGHPLWGDNRYGSGKPGQQIALWAWKLELTHPTLKTRMTFRALPEATGIWSEYADILEEMNEQ